MGDTKCDNFNIKERTFNACLVILLKTVDVEYFIFSKHKEYMIAMNKEYLKSTNQKEKDYSSDFDFKKHFLFDIYYFFYKLELKIEELECLSENYKTEVIEKLDLEKKAVYKKVNSPKIALLK